MTTTTPNTTEAKHITEHIIVASVPKYDWAAIEKAGYNERGSA